MTAVVAKATWDVDDLLSAQLTHALQVYLRISEAAGPESPATRLAAHALDRACEDAVAFEQDGLLPLGFEADVVKAGEPVGGGYDGSGYRPRPHRSRPPVDTDGMSSPPAEPARRRQPKAANTAARESRRWPGEHGRPATPIRPVRALRPARR